MILNNSKIPEDYNKRRQSLFKIIGSDGIAILPAALEIVRNGDVTYSYR